MEPKEAQALAKQLKLPMPKTWGDFFVALADRGLELEVDPKTGDWLVCKQNEVVAREA